MDPSSLPVAGMPRATRHKRFAGATLTAAHGHTGIIGLFAVASPLGGMAVTGNWAITAAKF